MYCPSCGTQLIKGVILFHHCDCGLEEFTPNLKGGLINFHQSLS